MKKQWAAFAGVVLTISGALIWSELRKVEAPVSPESILNFIGDTERELTRLPVAFVQLPDAEEIKIGDEIEKRYAKTQQQPNEDSGTQVIERYVQQVGSKVAQSAHRKLPYRFHYIPDLDFVNAFALPGGPVFIGGGLMALMETEDQLAAVLGHEIEHIDHFHCAERIQIQAALRRVPLGELVALPVEVFVAGYSKSQELEADSEGAKLAAEASYSPQGAIQTFEALERINPTRSTRSTTPQQEVSEIARRTLEGYFRSHPLNVERIDQIKKMIASGELPSPEREKPFLFAYVFLMGRAARALQAAQTRVYPFLSEKEKRERETAQVKQYEQAVILAAQSLHLRPDQPQAAEIFAAAKLALGDYTAAETTYRKLVLTYPTFADSIRIFADKLAQQALEARQYDKAAKLAAVSLQLQPNQADALIILAKVQLWLSDFTGAAETNRKLKNLYYGAADEVRTYADQLAASYLAKKQYKEAASFAAQSLEITPDQVEPLAILARAQFALANFSSAAAAYRRLVETDIKSDVSLVQSYADSVSAANLTTTTAHAFENWMTLRFGRTPSPFTTGLSVEIAGLMLMTGDHKPAKVLIARAQGADRDTVTPESLGRLGWWYYRAREYDNSSTLLRQAVEQRPGDLTLQSFFAWNELEQHQPEDAIRRFRAAAGSDTWNSPLMGRAIALWQTHQTEDALKDFETVAENLPEWLNPEWVKALYPASVAQSVAEMQAQRQKR